MAVFQLKAAEKNAKITDKTVSAIYHYVIPKFAARKKPARSLTAPVP
jgi:hypothetical protein